MERNGGEKKNLTEFFFFFFFFLSFFSFLFFLNMGQVLTSKIILMKKLGKNDKRGLVTYITIYFYYCLEY